LLAASSANFCWMTVEAGARAAGVGGNVWAGSPIQVVSVGRAEPAKASVITVPGAAAPPAAAADADRTINVLRSFIMAATPAPG